MKILFVDPPGKNKGLNTGLGYLSAVMKENHEIEVLDLNNIKMGLCGDPNPDLTEAQLEESTEDAVDIFDPDLIGISVKTFTAKVSNVLLRILKRDIRNLTIVAGGPHITLDGLTFLEENKIDFGIIGEGEYTLPLLCDALEGRRAMESINGIYYRVNGKLRMNPRNTHIRDLDCLPFPFYRNFSSVKANEGAIKEYPLLTSRGCPFKCSYCSMPLIMGGKWRGHSPNRVIEELRHAKEMYHCKQFTVVDDNLTLDLNRVEKICNLLILEEINLLWNSQNGIRADRIDDNLARKMKSSGCKYIWLGVESSDDKVFSTINKGEKLTDIEKGIRIFKNAGIGVGGFFIVGLPNSTRKTDLKSIQFVKRLGIDAWWFNFVPYPHTQAWDWVNSHGKTLRSIDGALQFGTADIEPVFETDDYSREDRMKTYDEIHIRMGYFDRLFNPSLSQWENLKRILHKTRPLGLKCLGSLPWFIITYNSRSILNKIKKYRTLRS